MALYEMRCPAGHTKDKYAPMSAPATSTSCTCGEVMRRVFTAPALAVGWVPHFSHTVGQYVSSRREFDAALSRGSDEASERTGMEHRYRAIDPEEAGATDEGMEATRRKHRELGWTKPEVTTIDLAKPGE